MGSEAIEKARKLGKEKRAEAKRELHKLFAIPEDVSSFQIERFVDLTIDAAILETAGLHGESAQGSLSDPNLLDSINH